MPAPVFKRGTLCVEDERTISCLCHRPLAEANRSFCQLALGSALTEENREVAELKLSGAPLVVERLLLVHRAAHFPCIAAGLCC